MTSPLLSLPGAVAVEGGSIAVHYGDPLREQRRLAEDAGLVDRSDRDVLAVPGADRLSWLHNLTSQHLDRLADSTGSEALVLSPHGHVEHHLVLADLTGTTWADVEPGTGPALEAFLQKMRFMLRVEPELVTDQWAVLSLVGPKADDVLTAAQLPVPVAPYGIRALDSGFARRMPTIGDGAPVVDLVVPRSGLAAVADRLLAAGAAPAGIQAYEALRVEARRPRLGVDSDHRTIPNELEWLRTAVHLDKGCYRGQETVARVHNLGRPPRRLVLLHLDGVSEVLAEPGTPVLAGTREVGRVGSVVRHHELGVIALALVKQSVQPGTGLAVAGSTASIDPGDGAAPPVDTAARERVRAVRSATIGR
ncbi:folate-binding protein [Blastococcus sp. CT_GayMR20]|uniref:CAF17-like 4Fe-4S cluster assembly/insertion protein YgfZ n=1 Tax=Blastococcus sp. CT_GayMR20 TaxID=2559609 RepID=UPI001073F634|nr:glycine cleavage T C-terminal barrel domain-containing protein [Blastococcus sp. CT_GayMR20]TFV82739.1 folate-binding protein [Blastococcus sp. CT_GayMR20]TFV82744.1 folate-binding protein [Blastococcus sp. CT_GayMR20]